MGMDRQVCMWQGTGGWIQGDRGDASGWLVGQTESQGYGDGQTDIEELYRERQRDCGQMDRHR